MSMKRNKSFLSEINPCIVKKFSYLFIITFFSCWFLVRLAADYFNLLFFPYLFCDSDRNLIYTNVVSSLVLWMKSDHYLNKTCLVNEIWPILEYLSYKTLRISVILLFPLDQFLVILSVYGLHGLMKLQFLQLGLTAMSDMFL